VAPLEDATGKDDENEEHFEESSVLHSELPSGDAPSSELETVDPTPITEGGLLDDVVMPAAEDVLCADIEQPSMELNVIDSIG